jgi:hypothetical protein
MTQDTKRTIQQNRALHKYFELLAKELNFAGLDMKTVLKPEVNIPWSTQTVKDFLWRPIMKAYLGKRSTTEMTTKDIDEIFEILNKHLGERFGEWASFVPWPSIEQLMEQNK